MDTLTAMTTVSTGATLSGTGTITGPVTVSGSISPGASIGTLVVMGSVTFMGGSTLNIEINPSASDRLVVSGTATLTGATLNVLPDPGTYGLDTTYTILTGNPVVGFFETVTGSLPSTRFQLQVLYFPTNVDLIINQPPFSSVIQGGNAGAVANAFDTMLNPFDPVADAINLSVFLDLATPVQLQCDFDQMQPALFNAIAITQETATTAVRSLLSNRLREIHGTKCERKLLAEKPCGLWVAPFGNFSKQRNRSQNGTCNDTKIGFHANTYGVTLGIDKKLFQNHSVILGGGLSYANTHLHWNESQAKSTGRSGFVNLYGTAFNKFLYLDLALMGAFVSFDARRHIFLTNTVGKMQRTAKHTNNAGELDVHAETGITFQKRCMQFKPYVALDYLFISEAGYRERGANSLNMSVKNKYSDLLRTETGISFASWQDRESIAWSEELRLSYVHEERYKGRNSHVRFTESSDLFVVRGFLPDRDLFSPSLILNLYFPKIHFSIAGSYSGEFGPKWKSQVGNLEFLWRF